MSIASLGEFALIDRLTHLLGRSRDPALLLSIGDDAAAWVPTPGSITVATTDALVEGVHFDLGTTGWIDLGWKAMAENVSDIAAMGCRPRYALIALGLPPERELTEIEDLYRGIAECASTHGFVVVGGDVVRAPSLVINVTMVGESLPEGRAAADRPLLVRSAAQVGDTIAVTGPLGASAAGLQLLLAGKLMDDVTAGHSEPATNQDTDALLSARSLLVRAHRRPNPRVTAGRALVEAGVRCAIDVSDGLVADLGHICERSGVDAEIVVDRVPVSAEAEEIFGRAALDLALAGGEDYELACAAPARTIARANEMLVQRGERPLISIGDVVAQVGTQPEVRLLGTDGEPRRLGAGGYQHFDPNR